MCDIYFNEFAPLCVRGGHVVLSAKRFIPIGVHGVNISEFKKKCIESFFDFINNGRIIIRLNLLLINIIYYIILILLKLN